MSASVSLYVKIRGPQNDVDEPTLRLHLTRQTPIQSMVFRGDHAFVHVLPEHASDLIRRTHETRVKKSTVSVSMSKRSRAEESAAVANNNNKIAEGCSTSNGNGRRGGLRTEDCGQRLGDFCAKLSLCAAMPPTLLANIVCSESNRSLLNLLLESGDAKLLIDLFSNNLYCCRNGDLVRSNMISEADCGIISAQLLSFYHSPRFDPTLFATLPPELWPKCLAIIQGVLLRFGPDVFLSKFKSSLESVGRALQTLVKNCQSLGLSEPYFETLAALGARLAGEHEQTAGAGMTSGSAIEIDDGDEDTAFEKAPSVSIVDTPSYKKLEFRVQPVLPSFRELAFEAPPTLTPIQVGAAVKSFDGHLDSVFRLAREDALRDLRNALRHIRRRMPPKGTDFKGFSDLRFSHLSANEGDGVSYVFHSPSFEAAMKKNPRSMEKRLIGGSLVVASTDGFQTGATGVTVNLFREDREKGYVAINLSDTLGSGEASLCSIGKVSNVSAVVSILEADPYWESYSHPLRAIQQMQRGDSVVLDRVMCAPIINSDSALLPTNPSINSVVKGFSAVVPFDSSQQEAFDSIFNQAAPIVQGPPGTGKSFVGVSAVRAMLQASNFAGPPIVVVCYTNHALDDFLCDLVGKEPSHFLCEEDGEMHANVGTLIRIGQRSRSQLIKEFTLKGAAQKNDGPFYSILSELVRSWNSAVNGLPSGIRFISDYFQSRKEKIQSQIRSLDAQLDSADAAFTTAAGRRAHDVYSVLKAIHVAGQVLKTRVRIVDAFATITQSLRSAMGRVAVGSKDSTVLTKGLSLLGKELVDLCRKHERQWLAYHTLEVRQEELKSKLANIVRDWQGEKGAARIKTRANDDHCYFQNQVEESASGQGLAWRKAEMDVSDSGDKELFEGADFTGFDTATAFPACLSRCHSLQNATNVLDSLNPEGRHQVVAYLKAAHFSQCVSSLNALIAKADRSTSEKIGNHALLGHLQNAQVIGATTSGLSRMLPLFHQLNVQFVVLEEAAEIPEYHALAAVLPGCPKFVQIGDHQQLRPKLNVHDLRRFNLNISLMERMLACNNSCKTLSIQRRMRPSICDFIRPFYQEKLKNGIVDHPRVVVDYPDSPAEYGLEPNNGWALWIDHAFPEQTGRNGSYCNQSEAEMAVALAWYFVRQRPEASITILVPYSAQYLLADSIVRSRYRFLLDKAALGKVRIATIDDFQGEESDVVILSLTRSSRVGFLGEDNRVCVALSRARHLQVVLGNFSVFRRLGSNMWKSLLDRAMGTPAGLSTSLSLYCKRHNSCRDAAITPDTHPLARAVSAGGGCFARCRQLMGCGHECESQCHGDWSCESSGVCRQPCERRRCGHACNKPCGEECDPCMRLIDARCECGGNVRVPCSEMPLPSGHYPSCPRIVETVLDCGHVRKTSCSEKSGADPSTLKIPCDAVCGKPLPCGHSCAQRCVDCFRDGQFSHPSCDQVCARDLPCGHVCSTLHTCSALLCSPCLVVGGCRGTTSNASQPKPAEISCVRLPTCGHMMEGHALAETLSKLRLKPFEARRRLQSLPCPQCGERGASSVFSFFDLDEVPAAAWAEWNTLEEGEVLTAMQKHEKWYAWQEAIRSACEGFYAQMIADATSSTDSQYIIPEMRAALLALKEQKEKVDGGVGSLRFESIQELLIVVADFVLWVLSRHVRRVGSARIQMMMAVRSFAVQVEKPSPMPMPAATLEQSISSHAHYLQWTIESLAASCNGIALKLNLNNDVRLAGKAGWEYLNVFLPMLCSSGVGNQHSESEQHADAIGRALLLLRV